MLVKLILEYIPYNIASANSIHFIPEFLLHISHPISDQCLNLIIIRNEGIISKS